MFNDLKNRWCWPVVALLLCGCGTGKSARRPGLEGGVTRADGAPVGADAVAPLPQPPADAAPGVDAAQAPAPGDAAPAPQGSQPDATPPCLRMVPVMGGAAALTAALSAATPGDCLLVADGAYGDLNISAKGTPTAFIQVRAMNRLKATAGGLHLSAAENVVVEGFALSTILIENSKHTRVTRCQVKGPGSGYWVRIEVQKGCMSGCPNTPPGTSDDSRIDHCDIGGGSSSSDIFNPTALSTNTRLDHNYIHDTSGDHLMTVGCCGAMYDYHDSNTIIEYNLFSKASGGGEMISIKGSNVSFRYNTVVGGGGDIDIRAGRRNNIYGNYIFGGAGIRLYEDDHKIYNNYVATGKSLQVGPGHSGHAAVKNAIIVFNTFLGSISLNDNYKFANNLVVGGGAGGAGNLAGSADALGLVKMGDVLAPTAMSKSVGAATETFPFVTDDITGTPRGPKADIGAQQFSPTPGPRRPLTTADVGPDAP
jgi:poly(beta-D-mannuronate) lyase